MNKYLFISDELMNNNKSLYTESYLLQVFVYLILNADEHGYYKEGLREMSKKIGIHHYTIKCKINRLVDFDFIEFSKPKSAIEIKVHTIQNYRMLRRNVTTGKTIF